VIVTLEHRPNHLARRRSPAAEHDIDLSSTISASAWRAKVGQSDAPSRVTASMRRPSTPPPALISSMASCVAAATLRSLMAIVPLGECRMPTRTGGPPSLPSRPSHHRPGSAANTTTTRITRFTLTLPCPGGHK